MSVVIRNGYLFQTSDFSPVSTNMDYPLNSEDERYYDIFGILTGKKYKEYDQAQRNQIYQTYLTTYPANGSTPCSTLETFQNELENEVKTQTAKAASNCDKGCQRIQSRYIDMANKRLGEIKNLVIAANCAAQDQATQNAQTLGLAQQILQTPTTTPTTGGASTISSALSGIGSALGLTGNNSTIPNTATTGGINGTGTNPTTGLPNPPATTKSNKTLLYVGLAAGAIILIIVLKKVF